MNKSVKPITRDEAAWAVSSHFARSAEEGLATVQSIELRAAMAERRSLLSLVLNTVDEEMAQVRSWSAPRDPLNTGFLQSAVDHSARAGALLSFVEVQICGSTGGHAPGQTARQRDTFQDRLDFARARVGEMK